MSNLPLIKGRAQPKSGENLARMNMPALAAKQDAAYDRAVTLIRANVFAGEEAWRSLVYEAVLKLLEIAIQAQRNIVMPLRASDPSPAAPDPILQYALLLKDTIQAAYALVTHEMILFKEEKQLSSFIGSGIASQFRSTDEIFANSEMNIFHSVRDLIEMAGPAISRHRERTKRAFSAADMERYKKAFMEYTALFAEYAPEARPENAAEGDTTVIIKMPAATDAPTAGDASKTDKNEGEEGAK